jgi:UDP-3-O-[3-hydroxymyristoyl] glucosamine N-acyltransferase
VIAMSKQTRTPHRLADLAAQLGGEVLGEGSTPIFQVAPLESARSGDLSFLTNAKYQNQLATTRASAVILDRESASSTTLPRIVCDNPYAYFARVSGLLNPAYAYSPGVDGRASVAETAHVDPDVYIGPGAIVDDGAEIGERVQIGAGCYIGRNARVGAGTLMHPNCTVYSDCIIGERAIIHSGAVIGADGFGMAMDSGRWVKIPQVGRVIIGADVEIGANTTIDRGALDDTIIEDDVKLDNQIQIGHNCVIGAHTAIAGCVGIAGSVRIGRYCRIGGSAMIIGHLEIADNVEISAGTLVPKSIRRPGKYTAVFPISDHEDWARNASLVRHLKELRNRIRDLEQQHKLRSNT